MEETNTSTIIREVTVLTRRQKLVWLGLLAMLFLSVTVWGVSQFMPIPINTQTTPLSLPTGNLYFSGATGNAGVIPNIFSLTIPDEKLTQITGGAEEERLHMSYYGSSSHNDEFFTIIHNGIDEQTGFPVMEPVLVYPDPNQPPTSGARLVRNFASPAGYLTHSFSLSPQENHFAFTTIFNFTNELDVTSPASWSIVNEIEGIAGRTSFAIPRATNPTWLDDDTIVFIREDGVYIGNVLADGDSQLFTASELGYERFTVSDKLALLPHSSGLHLILNKADNKEIIVMAIDKPSLTANPSVTTVQRMQIAEPDMTPVHPLALGDEHVAVVLVDAEQNKPDTVNIYQFDRTALKLVHSRTMYEFVPDSVILNYWEDTNTAPAQSPDAEATMPSIN